MKAIRKKKVWIFFVFLFFFVIVFVYSGSSDLTPQIVRGAHLTSPGG